MTQPSDKSIRGRRLQQKLRHIARQMRIRKAHAFSGPDNKVDSPHRYHKVTGVTCGDSRCFMCGNPRKFFKERTMQEKRQMQNVDTVRDHRSNGTTAQDE